MLKRLTIIFLFFIVTNASALAQCAMCRATLESNVSNGAETTLSGNLNLGILYLFAAPYLIVATVAFFWYKNTRAVRKTEGIA